MLQEVFAGKLLGNDLTFSQLDAAQLAQIAAIAAGFTGLLSLFNIGGRFFWASFSDYLGRKNTYFVFFALGFALYAMIPNLGHLGNVSLFVAAFCIILSMYGGGFATIPAYLADIFGTQFVGAGYHVAPSGNPDAVAIEVLGHVLTDAPAGRLHKALVETKLASKIEYNSVSNLEPGYNLFGALVPVDGNLDAAQAAMLKVLEEPPGDVVFLLVSHALQKLLPTLRSRCRIFPLTAPDQAQALAWLNSHEIGRASCRERVSSPV